MKLLSEIQYLPPVSFFLELESVDSLLIEVQESFQKQTYRNRCRILGANKIENLVVPVRRGRKHIPVREVMIDYSQKWLNVHWRSIASAYGKAPFFEFYKDFFHDILFKRHKFLFDLDIELLLLVLKLLGVNKPVGFSETYVGVTSELPQGIKDIRGLISPREEKVDKKNRLVEYNQVFGNKFVPDLSVIDLLFCEGPNSGEIIRRGTEQKVNKS